MDGGLDSSVEKLDKTTMSTSLRHFIRNGLMATGYFYQDKDLLYTHGCGDQSTVWQLENYDSKTGKYFIKDGGVEGNPGTETIRNWFKIEKHGKYGYKFVYCPSVCPYCKVICKDVGVYMVNGQRRLALSNVPLVFNFKKEFTS
ncbi:hypothetical protein HAX54_028856 [Datura stramonium]|uniref:Uncharacterized protein n=1 Tax=Datura stramonium TaxID=4076 RepID=A0ABS8V7F9_DATST|nr:hypothetical protein [Datura stramonium]